MMTSRRKQPNRRGRYALAAVSASMVFAASNAALASSHREAPEIAMMPAVDATDLYMFRSYESGRSAYVTVIADYIPFQDPQGGPNFYMFDPNAAYQIHFDTNGDSKPEVSFTFRFKNTPKNTALTIGTKQVKIPLIQSGPISGVDPATLNVRETYTATISRRGAAPQALTAVSTGASVFDKPVDNIGDKTFGSTTGYAAYAALHIYDVAIPGCGNGRMFVGQRKEPFYIAVGKIFDLFNMNPLGPEIGGNNNDLEAKNISTIALELPITCLATPTAPIVGAYTTASRPDTGSSTWTQVSRLGMPLVNEVVIGLADKDRFNESQPRDDAQFAKYVEYPTLPALIQSLFPTALAPTNLPRTDLVAAFLTGIYGLNQPRNVVPAEMLRLNTAVAPIAAGLQNSLGVAAGDVAGFPNGRRPGDDVVDLSIRVAMGALCVLTGPNDNLHVGCTPTNAPAGGLPFTDGVRKTSADFQAVFPYLNTPLPGNFNPIPPTLP